MNDTIYEILCMCARDRTINDRHRARIALFLVGRVGRWVGYTLGRERSMRRRGEARAMGRTRARLGENEMN